MTFSDFIDESTKKPLNESLNESFDLDNITLIKEPSIAKVLIKIVPGISFVMSYSINISGTRYIIHRFEKNGALEFHFLDWDNNNDMGTNSIPRKDGIKVISAVLRAIYDNKQYNNSKHIRICFEKNREKLYISIFNSVKLKYFSEYKVSRDPYFYETLVNPETKEETKIWAFDIFRGDISKTVPTSELKRIVKLNNTDYTEYTINEVKC